MIARFRLFYSPLLLSLIAMAGNLKADEKAYEVIEPILVNHCYDCHGDGMDKGDFVIDDFVDLTDYLTDFDTWYEIWKNVRSNLMPPSDKPQLEPKERQDLLAFIEAEVFKIDRKNPDPGRVTIRRLNREEYRYTIKDLFNHDFKVEENFPADDTGYGFDTIGDVLSISPLLMEKYLEAAEHIAEAVIPLQGPEITEWRLDVKSFRDQRSETWSPSWMPFDSPRKMVATPYVSFDGEYELRVDYDIRGSNEKSSHTGTLKVGVGEKVLGEKELAWSKEDRLSLKTKVKLKKGRDETFWIATEAGDPLKAGDNKLAVSVSAIRLRGPLDGSHKDYPWNARHLFSKGPPSADKKERDLYRREIIKKVATRAFRRPVDDETVNALTSLALNAAGDSVESFEEGIAEAVTAILVSPRFLMRAEIQPEPNNPDRIVPIDEYALASRLSYFLWSSLPDEPLLKLASEGKLRSSLRSEVDRMLKDPKSDRMIKNFVGQWLQARDVEGISLNARSILGVKDSGEAARIFNRQLRLAMRLESEEYFAHILREDRPAVELLASNYTFLNEELAKWYGVKGVKGGEMRKVELPKDSQRGGLLTQATFHIVTSNPTRTSPVKRGLYVLENFLATPPPPATPNVPPLEEAAKGKKKNLTLRELMKLHSEEKICASCHARMDPIGLALENFNAIGMWRDDEKGQPIDTAGVLMTGETFSNAKELAQVLASSRKGDFHRALVEKLMTYATGRGIEYYDSPSIDKVIADAEKEGGTLRHILYGVVESAPFQKRRGDGGFNFSIDKESGAQ